MAEYRIKLDVYNGPLDLLLYLIRRDELDIYDIPIARVTEQYVKYVELLKTIDINVAGDFLVMAASLMELKSQLLLPRPVVEEGQEDFSDPRLDLVRQLLEYKKYKDVARELGHNAQEHAHRFSRQPPKLENDPAELDMEDVQVWDLLEAFNSLLEATGSGPAMHEVVYDDTPLELYVTDLLDRVQREQTLTFAEIFAGRRTRAELIGLFLALLELTRRRQIRVEQSSDFSSIYISINTQAGQTEEEQAPPPIHPVQDVNASDNGQETGDGAR